MTRHDEIRRDVWAAAYDRAEDTGTAPRYSAASAVREYDREFPEDPDKDAEPGTTVLEDRKPDLEEVLGYLRGICSGGYLSEQVVARAMLDTASPMIEEDAPPAETGDDEDRKWLDLAEPPAGDIGPDEYAELRRDSVRLKQLVADLTEIASGLEDFLIGHVVSPMPRELVRTYIERIREAITKDALAIKISTMAGKAMADGLRAGLEDEIRNLHLQIDGAYKNSPATGVARPILHCLRGMSEEILDRYFVGGEDKDKDREERGDQGREEGGES